MMRVLIAELKHEANTFSPIPTTLDRFRDYHHLTGAEVLTLAGTRTEVGGFLDVAQEAGWEVAPVVAAMAMSGGKVTTEAYATLKDQLLNGLGRVKKHLPEPQSILSGVRRCVPDAVEGCTHQESGYAVTKTHPSTAPRELLRDSAQDASSQNRETFCDEYSVAGDAVLLALHGAMVVEGLDDPEGDLLCAVREAVGPHVPIAASLDLHGNITPATAQAADILVGFDTCPHTDLYETGVRTARLLARRLRGEIRPATALVRVPLIVPPDTMDTSDGPLGEIVAAAKAMERRPGVLSASVFCVQPWLDLPDLASGVLVTTDGDPELAAATARELAHRYWAARRSFHVELHSPEEAIALARSEAPGPVVFSDSADSIGSGATGDATGILAALLAAAPEAPGLALTTVVDPEAATACVQAGVGAMVSLLVGGKLDRRFNTPIRLSGRVRTLFDGRFRLSGPSYGGLEMQMGLTAVVQANESRVYVVITSLPTWTHHPDFYRAVGLAPERAWVVVTKSNILFRASYRDLARRILWVSAPGLSSPHLTGLPFERVGRPLYPLDAMEAFDDRAEVHVAG
jgi:microcystin degradation protein MlrC